MSGYFFIGKEGGGVFVSHKVIISQETGLLLQTCRLFVDLPVQKLIIKSRDEDPTFFSMEPDGKKCGSGSGWKKNADPDPTLNRNEEKNIFIF